ncbi:MAG: hypothetical protein JXM73_22610 [Anaerolineae bacterium]|nr:hypothetical protein [Anaerolineae bacterium]
MFPRMFSKGLKYNYAHIFLPMLVFAKPDWWYQHLSGPHGELLLRKTWIELGGSVRMSEPPEGLSVSHSVLRDDIEAYVIHLPRPTESPEAVLVALVFQVGEQLGRKQAESVRYFTVELAPDIYGPSERYMLCEWVGGRMTKGEHRNYGQIPDDSERTFLAAIGRLI